MFADIVSNTSIIQNNVRKNKEPFLATRGMLKGTEKKSKRGPSLFVFLETLR
jgi:hypothetical protein